MSSLCQQEQKGKGSFMPQDRFGDHEGGQRNGEGLEGLLLVESVVATDRDQRISRGYSA